MKTRWLGLVFALLALGFSAAVLTKLPEQVPTHFDIHGEPDDWMSRNYAAFAVPIFAFALMAMFNLLPKISPRRQNLDRFDDTYWLIANTVVLFVCALHVLVLGRALGWPVDIASATLFGVGLLFMVLGNVLPRTRSNWWMGIRTPWTMESENVWRATHRLAGKTFMVGGAVTVIAAMLPESLRPWVAIGALFVAGFIPVFYSYLYWRREKAA
jgi:uncharacterized membrane protein